MRNFLRALRKARTASCKMREARLSGRFARPRIEPLHAHADTQKRYAPSNCGAYRRREPNRVNSFRSREVANPGKHNPLRRIYRCNIGIRYCNVGAEITQRLEDLRQIARLVIDDGYAHQSNPFVDGSISPSCLSREHATRSARAKALKIASI